MLDNFITSMDVNVPFSSRANAFSIASLMSGQLSETFGYPNLQNGNEYFFDWNNAGYGMKNMEGNYFNYFKKI